MASPNARSHAEDQEIVLGLSDCNDVVIACLSVSAHWRTLGTRLGVLVHALDNIEANHRGDVKIYMAAMIAQWLRRPIGEVRDDVRPTWRSLCVALSYIDRSLAERLAEEHDIIMSDDNYESSKARSATKRRKAQGYDSVSKMGDGLVLPTKGHEEIDSAVKPTIDLASIQLKTFNVPRHQYNLQIKQCRSFDDGGSECWFTFDHALENGIEVHVQCSSSGGCTLKVVKCSYLSIEAENDVDSFDMEGEFVNITKFRQMVESSTNMEKYLRENIVPIIIKKIKYTKYKPQFRFFLSHKTKDKPFMRTFKNGLEFLGYSTWLDTDNMPFGASLPGALKTNIDNCDCLIAWLNREYLTSEYCKAELVYAHQKGKIILPFGIYDDIKDLLKDDLLFLKETLIYDTNTSSFFEILRRIDETLFDVEKLPL